MIPLNQGKSSSNIRIRRASQARDEKRKKQTLLQFQLGYLKGKTDYAGDLTMTLVHSLMSKIFIQMQSGLLRMALDVVENVQGMRRSPTISSVLIPCSLLLICFSKVQ